ncbi:hypothetical protein [Azorhizobium]|uniref:hypothetical protein n=1 Tax=Azorhizobium TaxID=6 RepID=UPI0002DEF0F6|nr:hypothetical protein [Azorhizobium]TDT94600.1 hypothetical protein DFO45_2350 [Azorhizobium sp. AG788]
MQEPTERREEREFYAGEGTGIAGEPVKPQAQAKQGIGSGRVLTVLACGIALVVIGFAVSYLGAV